MQVLSCLPLRPLHIGALLCALIPACAPTAAAQTEIPGTVADRSVVEGRVLTAGNQPLRGATVVLVDFNGTGRRTTFTDESGAFVFSNLRPGQYQVQVTLAALDRGRR